MGLGFRRFSCPALGVVRRYRLGRRGLGGRGLSRWSLGRRSLNRRRLPLGHWGVAMRSCFGRLIADGLSFHGPQFPAVAEQNLNQIALRLNGRALLNDEQGHQDVGAKENHCEQRHKGPLLLRNRNWHHRCVTEQCRQVPPRSCPATAGTERDCSLFTNGRSGRKALNLLGLVGV